MSSNAYEVAPLAGAAPDTFPLPLLADAAAGGVLATARTYRPTGTCENAGFRSSVKGM